MLHVHHTLYRVLTVGQMMGCTGRLSLSMFSAVPPGALHDESRLFVVILLLVCSEAPARSADHRSQAQLMNHMLTWAEGTVGLGFGPASNSL